MVGGKLFVQIVQRKKNRDDSHITGLP